MAGEEALEIEVDPVEFARVMRELKGLDKALATAIRKEIRDAAKLVMNDVQAEIRSYPNRTGRSTGMREQLARSFAVRIGTAKGGTKQGVFIVSTGRLLPANKKQLVKALNRASFRHPVFGTRRWVDQTGLRYFRQSVVTKHESALTAALTSAVERAAKVVDA